MVFLLPLYTRAQFRPDTSKNVNYLIVPALFRAPETGWAGGASASLSFKTSFKNDTTTRISVIQALALFTQKKQNIAGINATIFFPKEKYILLCQALHSYFPDKFWGMGADTKNEWEESYAFEQLYLYAHLKRRLKKRLFVGAITEFQNLFKVRHQTGSVFDTSAFYGKTPYKILGTGFSISYDSRNFTFWPTKGIFIQSYFISYNTSLVSDFNFNKWVTDLRAFKTVFKNQVLAFQLYNYSTFGNSPFRSLASLGGESNLRGFYQGRFRDNNLISCIAEYRAPVYGPIAVCVFAGAGNVFSDFSSISTSSVKYNFGGGIRIAVLKKEKLNLRVDYGFSDKYNQGFYFTIGECF